MFHLFFCKRGHEILVHARQGQPVDEVIDGLLERRCEADRVASIPGFGKCTLELKHEAFATEAELKAFSYEQWT